MARAKPSNFTGSFGTVNDYNPYALQKRHTVKELRSEYRAMRREAKSRLSDLRNSEFSNAQVLENKEYLNKDPSNMTKRELANAMGYTAGFLNSDLSTIEGQAEYRENVIQSFADMGYDQINDANFSEFDRFMRKAAVYIKNKIIGSPDALEMYQKAKENNISVANMEKNMSWYYHHMDELEDLDLNTGRKRKYTTTQLERIINKRNRQED